MLTGRMGAWGVAVVHLAIAVLVLWRLAGGTARLESGSAPALRVMTLNAAYSQGRDSGRLREELDSTQPHVVALQEAPIELDTVHNRWVAPGIGLVLLGNSAYSLTRLDRPSPSSGRPVNGNPLFTRLSASPTRRVLLDTSSTTSGTYTRTEVEWGGQTVAVYNVHFRSFTVPRPSSLVSIREWFAAFRASKRDFVAREAEARTLRRVLDAETIPFLVLGDFNATPDHWTYAHVAHGLVDALDVAKGWAATYPDARPLVRIDGILASSEWGLRRTVILPPGLSDHRAVLADLELVP